MGAVYDTILAMALDSAIEKLAAPGDIPFAGRQRPGEIISGQSKRPSTLRRAGDQEGAASRAAYTRETSAAPDYRGAVANGLYEGVQGAGSRVGSAVSELGRGTVSAVGGALDGAASYGKRVADAEGARVSAGRDALSSAGAGIAGAFGVARDTASRIPAAIRGAGAQIGNAWNAVPRPAETAARVSASDERYPGPDGRAGATYGGGETASVRRQPVGLEINSAGDVNRAGRYEVGERAPAGSKGNPVELPGMTVSPRASRTVPAVARPAPLGSDENPLGDSKMIAKYREARQGLDTLGPIPTMPVDPRSPYLTRGRVAPTYTEPGPATTSGGGMTGNPTNTPVSDVDLLPRSRENTSQYTSVLRAGPATTDALLSLPSPREQRLRKLNPVEEAAQIELDRSNQRSNVVRRYGSPYDMTSGTKPGPGDPAGSRYSPLQVRSGDDRASIMSGRPIMGTAASTVAGSTGSGAARPEPAVARGTAPKSSNAAPAVAATPSTAEGDKMGPPALPTRRWNNTTGPLEQGGKGNLGKDSNNYIPDAKSQYTVRAGQGLQSVAKGMYGDQWAKMDSTARAATVNALKDRMVAGGHKTLLPGMVFGKSDVGGQSFISASDYSKEDRLAGRKMFNAANRPAQAVVQPMAVQPQAATKDGRGVAPVGPPIPPSMGDKDGKLRDAGLTPPIPAVPASAGTPKITPAAPALKQPAASTIPPVQQPNIVPKTNLGAMAGVSQTLQPAPQIPVMRPPPASPAALPPSNPVPTSFPAQPARLVQPAQPINRNAPPAIWKL